MKKILSIAAALVVAAAFISCGDSGDSFDGKTDTVLTIGAPSVTAKAYPGVNYITWTPVSQAVSYDIYRIADGAATGTNLGNVPATAGTAKDDVASTTNILADGVTYKYVVIAVPSNNGSTATTSAAPGANEVPARAIYVKANQGSASVKAYVPAAGTEITAFTDSYTKNFLKKYADEKTIAKNAKVTLVNKVAGGADLYATYAATAGFNFGVEFINKTHPEYINASKTASTTGVYLEGYTGNATTPALAGGEYEAYLTVAPVCSLYPTTVTYDLGKYTVPELAVTTATAIKTTDTTAYQANGSKIVLAWTPAVLKATGKKAEIADYKVYRGPASSKTTDSGATEWFVAKGDELTEIKGTITSTPMVVKAESVKTGTEDYVADVYTITDDLSDDAGKKLGNAGDYVYYIVTVKDGEFESGERKLKVSKYSQTKTKAPTLTISSDMISKDSSNVKNCIKIVATKGCDTTGNINTVRAAQTLELYYVPLDKANYGTGYTKTINASEWKKIDLANPDVTESNWTMYVDAPATGTYLFRLTATENGFANAVVYETYQVGLGSVDVANLTIATNGEDKKAIVIDDIGELDLGLYDYFLTCVETTHARTDFTDYITVTSTEKSIKLEVKHGIDGTASDFATNYTDKGILTVTDSKDNAKLMTKPYVIVDGIEKASKDKDKLVNRVWSVKKSLKADKTGNTFKYSDNKATPSKVSLDNDIN